MERKSRSHKMQWKTLCQMYSRENTCTKQLKMMRKFRKWWNLTEKKEGEIGQLRGIIIWIARRVIYPLTWMSHQIMIIQKVKEEQKAYLITFLWRIKFRKCLNYIKTGRKLIWETKISQNLILWEKWKESLWILRETKLMSTRMIQEVTWEGL